ncbi:MAG: glutamate--tRNA ligase, partial [Nitrosopumilaceae archaeon]
SLSFTKSDTLAPFETLESFNRKIIDPTSIRLFIAIDPVKLTITNNNITEIEIPNHPQKDMGKRKIELDGIFYISGQDIKNLKLGDEVRLLELYNIKITKLGVDVEAEVTSSNFKPEIPKIQWVPSKSAIKIEVLVPKILFVDEKFNENSLEIVQALTEPYYLELNVGAEIQFVRYGYCRKDSANQVVYTHR